MTAGAGPRAVIATAPVRVCDAGGWTDTWFARRGLVCSLAVSPGAEVRARNTGSAEATTVTLDVTSFGDRYSFAPGERPGRHPLLEAAVAAAPLPKRTALEVTVRSALPPGCGTGTSAAVVVALLGGLYELGGTYAAPDDIAATAHGVETEGLGLQSGVQDQIAAVHGGANLIEIDEYPRARVTGIELAEATLAGLERRLVTIYLGRPHRSSAIHEQVIAHLEDAPNADEWLEPLRAAAQAAAEALAGGDLDAYGRALTANTEAQAALHPDLVGLDARRLAHVAESHGAAGWKVNGAGGDGGTVTVVGPPDPAALLGAIAAEPGWRVLPLRPTLRGLVVRPRR